MTDMRIGWIGLGAIGTEMVKRLLAAGEAVTAYPRGVGLAEVQAAGAGMEADYAALAAGSDLLVLCVYKDAQLSDILFDGDALASLRPGSLLVIHTTGSPALVREIAASAPEGVAVMDVCFSGGPHDAAAGRLTLMAGGEGEALDRVRPILGHYAAHIHHVGPIGHGQMLKLLNNLVFATNLINVAELVALAERQGFSGQTVARVLATCSGSSYALGIFDKPAPTAAILQGIRPYLEKDVATALATAAEAGLDIGPFEAVGAYFRPT